MKRTLSILTAAAFAVATAVPVFAQTEGSKPSEPAASAPAAVAPAESAKDAGGGTKMAEGTTPSKSAKHHHGKKHHKKGTSSSGAEKSGSTGGGEAGTK